MPAERGTTGLRGQRAGDGQHRHDDGEAANRHPDGQGHIVERRVGAEAGEGAAVGHSRRGVGIEDLGKAVRAGRLPGRPAPTAAPRWR